MFHADATFLLVAKHFNEDDKILEKLYEQDESFRSLCEDFGDCIRAMEYWCGSHPAKGKATAHCEEYKILFADLKKEIAERLAEQKIGA